jgi:hypothetical protein
MASSLKPQVKSYKAGGAINPRSFVKFTTSSPYSNKNPGVVQCGAGDRPCGIAQNEVAAASGDTVEVAFPGGGGLLHIAGTVSPGDMLKSDGSGYGIRTTTAGDAYGAQAEEGGASGDDIGVTAMVGEKYNATA